MSEIEQADAMADRALRQAFAARRTDARLAWVAVAEYYCDLVEALLETPPPGFSEAMAAPLAEVA